MRITKFIDASPLGELDELTDFVTKNKKDSEITIEQAQEKFFLRYVEKESSEEVKQEIARADAICGVAGQVVAGASLALRATCIAGQINIPDVLKIGMDGNGNMDYGEL